MTMMRDFAGAERAFRLGYGEIMDLETACGEVALATIYKSFGAFDWKITYVFQVLRIALIGGGMRSDEARSLVKERVDAGRIGELMTLAFDILIETLEGAPKAEGASSGGEATPIDRGLVYKSFAEVGIPPQEVDAMEFAKVLHLYAALGRDGKGAPPSPEEFAEMRARVDSGALDWSLQPETKGDRS